MPFGNIDANTAVAFLTAIQIVVLAANASATASPKSSITHGFPWRDGYHSYWEDGYYSCLGGSLLPFAMCLCCRLMAMAGQRIFPNFEVRAGKTRSQRDWRNEEPATHLSAHW
jgi:hypothetical protein